MQRKIIILFLGLSLAAASLSWGQPAGEFGGGGFQDRFQAVKRNQLGPALGVNQHTVDKLLAIEGRYKPVRRKMIMEMMNEWRRLEQAMRQASPSEQEIKSILANLRHRKEEMHKLQQRQSDEEVAILTPVQQARYMLYQRSLLQDARSIKSGGGGHGGKGGPGVFSSPGGAGGPGGLGAPAFRPSQEIPVSRPPQ